MEILNTVFQIIQARAKEPQEGSYTNYLLTKGVDKICKKIGEEATEMVIAAKNNDKSELIGECADVLYHALVLMHVQGITPADVAQELENRFGKGGYHGRTDKPK